MDFFARNKETANTSGRDPLIQIIQVIHSMCLPVKRCSYVDFSHRSHEGCKVVDKYSSAVYLLTMMLDVKKNEGPLVIAVLIS